MCANLNYCKVKKAEPSQLIPQKVAANLEFLILVEKDLTGVKFVLCNKIGLPYLMRHNS